MIYTIYQDTKITIELILASIIIYVSGLYIALVITQETFFEPLLLSIAVLYFYNSCKKFIAATQQIKIT